MSNKVTKNVIIKMTKIGNQVTKHVNKGNRAYQQRNKNVNRVTKHVIKEIEHVNNITKNVSLWLNQVAKNLK